MRYWFALLALTLIAGGVASARPMRSDDVYGIASAVEPEFSPDGRTLVFIERHVNVEADRFEGEGEFVDVASAPRALLILSDVGDVRVPIAQSFEMYRRLRDRHIPVRLVGIPVHLHYPGDPVRRGEIDRLWLGWLDDHLK